MAPNVDFYILNETPLSACYRFICKLVDKAYLQKHQVYIHTNSLEEAKILDDLLWIFRDDSFMPHDICEKNLPPTVPVQLGYDIIPEHHQDILVNLTAAAPAFFTQFKRVLEIVPGDDAARTHSREKYRFYRDKGCEVNSHEIA